MLQLVSRWQFFVGKWGGPNFQSFAGRPQKVEGRRRIVFERGEPTYEETTSVFVNFRMIRT